MALTCPDCGNEKSFQVKTLQMHVVQAGGSELELSDQSTPAVFELLCDECETEVDFASLEADERRELMLLLGAG
tara:strand:+ start:410 stop:631 length:222 start_codon:yes stop_codon:yes gene_type:complete